MTDITLLPGNLIRSGSIPYWAIQGSVTSASYSQTASAATSITFTPSTASFSTTASAATSITFTPSTASFATTASAATSITFTPSSASFATTSSYVNPTGLPVGTVSSSGQVSYTGLSNIPSGIVSSSTQVNSGSFTGSFVGTLTGTSSWASNATTASAATSITFTPSTASFSTTSSYVNPLGLPSGIVSSSAQVTPLLPTGTISGSSQLTSSYDTRYETQGRGIISSSAQIAALGYVTNGGNANFNTTLANGYTIIAWVNGSAGDIFSRGTDYKINATTSTIAFTSTPNGNLSATGNFTINGATVYNTDTFTLNSAAVSNQNGTFSTYRPVASSGVTANAAIRWIESSQSWRIRDILNSNESFAYANVVTSNTVSTTKFVVIPLLSFEDKTEVNTFVPSVGVFIGPLRMAM